MTARAKPGAAGPLASKDRLLAWVEDYADRQGLDAQRTLFLGKFASFASAAMESWSKVDSLARLARCSERMIQKLREEFVEAGVLELTGRFHTLEGTDARGLPYQRKVPLYRWRLFLDEIGAAASGACGAPEEGDAPGAPRAPEGGAGVHGNGASGAQGVHLYMNQEEPNSPSGEGEARARRREALFEEIEGAVPKACLGNTERHRARAELHALLDEGVDGAGLVAAARAWAADPTAKRKDLGLHYWLADRRYRRWWPEPETPAEAQGGAAGGLATACDDGATAAWMRTMAAMQTLMGPTEFATWLSRASLGQIGAQLYVVAWSGPAVEHLRRHRWAALLQAWAAAWAEASGAVGSPARDLTLTTRHEFEALLRQSEG